jgi:apolipoprotein N-acyltransferase
VNLKEPLRVPLALLLAAASAPLLFAAGEPLGWGPLAWVALVPLFVAVLRAPRSRWAFGYGLVFGLLYFGVELWWIFLFGWMAWTALTLVMALYMAIGTLVAGWARRSAFAPMLVAGALVGAELLRDRWPYGGYSWGSVGTTQASVPGVRWLAGTIGVYGLSFLCAFVAALIAHRIASGHVVFSNVIVVGLVLSVFVLIDLASYGKPAEGRTMRMAVVQGNVPRPVQVGQRDLIFQSHMDLTMDLLGDPSEPADTLGRVVIWPEDSLGIGVSEGAFEQVVDLAGSYGTPFLVGHSVLEGPEDAPRFLNLVDYIDATGRHRASYQKRHPVPFGEYVPIPFFRRFVSTLESEIPTDQEPGSQAVVFDLDGTKVATPICFESVFGRDFRDFARKGAEVYVLSTNDASFERSYASEQHLAHTRMRALENRQWVVQAALSGISASIAPDGEITHRTDIFDATAFETEVGVRPPQSLYAKTGDLFASLFAAVAALATLWTMLRRRRSTPES